MTEQGGDREPVGDAADEACLGGGLQEVGGQARWQCVAGERQCRHQHQQAVAKARWWRRVRRASASGSGAGHQDVWIPIRASIGMAGPSATDLICSLVLPPQRLQANRLTLVRWCTPRPRRGRGRRAPARRVRVRPAQPLTRQTAFADLSPLRGARCTSPNSVYPIARNSLCTWRCPDNHAILAQTLALSRGRNRIGCTIAINRVLRHWC